MNPSVGVTAAAQPSDWLRLAGVPGRQLMPLLLGLLCTLVLVTTVLVAEPSKHSVAVPAAMSIGDLSSPDQNWTEPNPELLLTSSRILVTDTPHRGAFFGELQAADAGFAHRPPARAPPQHA